jgi:hypothetical protein
MEAQVSDCAEASCLGSCSSLRGPTSGSGISIDRKLTQIETANIRVSIYLWQSWVWRKLTIVTRLPKMAIWVCFLANWQELSSKRYGCGGNTGRESLRKELRYMKSRSRLQETGGRSTAGLDCTGWEKTSLKPRWWAAQCFQGGVAPTAADKCCSARRGRTGWQAWETGGE